MPDNEMIFRHVANRSRSVVGAVLAVSALIARADGAESYDPLRLNDDAGYTTEDRVIVDLTRDRRIPIRLYIPTEFESAPVILFSHGLGGSRAACRYLGKHWASRGYLAVFLQHPGSDESIWKDLPVRERLTAMKNAPSAQNSLDRFRDVSVVLDRVSRWNAATDHPWAGKLAVEAVGMSGHSYGAATTQGVGGQSSARGGQRFTDRRVKAAIMFSPNIPRWGDPSSAFGKVAIPWMLMTGTLDTSPINDTTVEDRLKVYPALPENLEKYQLVLHEGRHSAFSDASRFPGRRPRNPNHHRIILALSTAFWDTHLRKNPDAREWLHGAAPRRLLEPRDRWQLSHAPAKILDGP